MWQETTTQEQPHYYMQQSSCHVEAKLM
jgi:hypothetical protein